MVVLRTKQNSRVLDIAKNHRDFPGNPVVKTSPSNKGNAGSIPGCRSKIPHASWPKKKKKKKKKLNRSNIIRNSI